MKNPLILLLFVPFSACIAHKQGSKSNAGKTGSAEKPRIYGYKFVPKDGASDPFVLKMPADTLNGPVKMPNSNSERSIRPVPMPTLKTSPEKLK